MHVLGKIAKIKGLKNQLTEINDKIYFVKRVFIITTTIIVLLDIFTLFYYFESIISTLKITGGFLILFIIAITLYINQLKSNSQKIKLLMYQEQKL